MTVNINAANISSVQLAAAQTPSAPSAGFVRLHHNANSRLAMRPATGNVVEFLGNTSGSGAGITFPATQSPSTDANTLDDYEEGTWTPTLAAGFSSAPTGYTTRTGKYTKIGNVVYIAFDIDPDGATANADSVTFSGLPYTSSSSVPGGALYVAVQNSFNTNTTDVYYIGNSSSTILVLVSTTVGRAGNAAGVNINNRIILCGFYYT